MNRSVRLLPYFVILLVACFAAVLSPSSAHARDDRLVFKVKEVFSDGKGGRIWRQWRQSIPERTVERVEVVLTRVSGGDDTFVNLRYGDGETFEHGKQFHVRADQKETAAWEVSAPPLGQPLVLNAYNGEVRVDKVIVYYDKPGGAAIQRDVEDRWSNAGGGRRQPDGNSEYGSGKGDGEGDMEERCRRARRIRGRAPSRAGCRS